MDNQYVDINNIGTLDELLEISQPIGSIEKALSNNLFGINHEQTKGVIQENRDTYGFTFFTRPQLNLSSPNLRNIRPLYNFLTNNEFTIQRYVRNSLDPRLARPGGPDKDSIKSPLVDEANGFISMLTNTIKNVSGWPDIVAPSFTSASGVKKEQWSIMDGSIEVYESFDLDCSFRNIKNEPTIMMFQTWLYYMAKVFEGMMSPYIDMISNNEIDYNTRIYRLVLDESKRFVTKIAATGASFPVNVPIGKFFDYTDENKYNMQTKDINIRFKCLGASYNDPILVKEFNEVSAIFNSDVRNLLNGDKHNLEEIPHDLLKYMNNRGYPIIDPITYELKWYLSKTGATYKALLKTIKDKNPNTKQTTGTEQTSSTKQNPKSSGYTTTLSDLNSLT